jgi:hypothetical protein
VIMPHDLGVNFPTHGKSSVQMNDRKPKAEMPTAGKPKSNTPRNFPHTIRPGGSSTDKSKK